MIDVGFDFTGRRVLVTGGTRGLGLTIAKAFLEAGADVSITGCKILPSLYDADLSRFDYHQLQLASSEAIDSFVDRIGNVDVLVNTAGARLKSSLEEHEREFISHSARLGFVGPLRLAQQLRYRLCSSTVPGGGAVIHTGLTQRWLELAQPPAAALEELVAQTSRTGQAWARLGARVNTVLAPARLSVPSQQQRPYLMQVTEGGSVMTRPRMAHGVTGEQVATIALFLASSGAAAITGQVIQADGPR